MSLLDDLNPAQREAVQNVDGPLLVLAGAGSGKTRALTYRVAHLIRDLDVTPWSILAVTFTNKAAGEMKQRIEQLVGGRAKRVWIGTFHSICARILRYEADSFGLDSNFTIYDEDDRRSLMRRVMKTGRGSEQELAARTVVGQISRAKNARRSRQSPPPADRPALPPGYLDVLRSEESPEAEAREENLAARGESPVSAELWSHESRTTIGR